MRRAVLQNDAALPALAAALEPEAMTRRLAPLVSRLQRRESAGVENWRVVEIDILKYKPGHRCALGYTLDGPGARQRLFAKAYTSERGQRIEETMGMIAAAIPREALLIPVPVSYLPDLKLLVTEYLRGIPLSWFLHEERFDIPARRAAFAIAVLHRCNAPLGRRWTASQEVANTGSWLARSPAGSLACSGRAEVLLDALRRGARLLDEAPEKVVHRDFYPEQVWDCKGRTALLDLDDAQLGDGAVDVGNFLAHLRLRSLQFPRLTQDLERMRPVFQEEYARQQTDHADMKGFSKRVGFYEAATLLRLSSVYSLRERWAHFLPQALLDSCEAVLDASG